MREGLEVGQDGDGAALDLGELGVPGDGALHDAEVVLVVVEPRVQVVEGGALGGVPLPAGEGGGLAAVGADRDDRVAVLVQVEGCCQEVAHAATPWLTSPSDSVRVVEAAIVTGLFGLVLWILSRITGFSGSSPIRWG